MKEKNGSWILYVSNVFANFVDKCVNSGYFYFCAVHDGYNKGLSVV